MDDAVRTDAERRAERRTKDWTALMWHIATYVIINGFLWIIVPSAAPWVMLGWGIGLAFHIAAYLIGDDGPTNRRYRKYLAEEQARATHEEV